MIVSVDKIEVIDTLDFQKSSQCERVEILFFSLSLTVANFHFYHLCFLLEAEDRNFLNYDLLISVVQLFDVVF